MQNLGSLILQELYCFELSILTPLKPWVQVLQEYKETIIKYINGNNTIDANIKPFLNCPFVNKLKTQYEYS